MRSSILSLIGSIALAASAFLPWLRLGNVGLPGIPDPAGFFVLAVTHSWWMLVPQVLLTAAGQGFASPSLTATISGRIDPAVRGELMGTQQSFGSLARVLGPLGGGLLYDHIDIAAPFIVGGVLYAVAAILVVRARARTSAVLSGAGPGAVAAASASGH